MADLILQEFRDHLSEDLSQILHDEKMKMFGEENCHFNEEERRSLGFEGALRRMGRLEKEKRKTC